MGLNAVIELERTRTAVIAAVMLGMLLVSIALANWYSVAHSPGVGRSLPFKTHLIGELELGVPEEWDIASLEVNPIMADTLAVFLDPARSDRRLIIASRHSPTPTTPSYVFERALVQLTQGRSWKLLHNKSVRHGSIVSDHYVALIHTQGAEIRLHRIAVVTEDARRYWILDLSEPFDLRMIGEQENIVWQIIRAMKDHGLRDVERADLQRASVWFDTPAHLRAQISSNWDLSQPLNYVPRHGEAMLWLIRLRVVPDMGDPDAEDRLAPHALLAQQFYHLAGRPPQSGEIWSGSLNGVDAWCAAINRDDTSSFSRELWYVRIHGHTALLMEVLLDAARRSPRGDWIKSLLEAASSRQPGEVVPCGGRDVIDAARQRGTAIAQKQRSELRHLEPLWRYYLFEGSDGVVGFAVERILPPLLDDDLSLRGRIKTAIFGHGRAESDESWASSIDGLRYQLVSRIAITPRDGRTRTSVEQTHLEQGKLSSSIVTASGPEPNWSFRPPPNYVPPPCEEIWPVEADDLPALVWLSRNRFPPQPCWIDSPAGNSGSQTLYIRPIMSMDTDTATLDAKGRVQQNQWFDRAGAHIGRTVELDVLLERFPQVQEDLETWQQDVDIDD